MNLFVVLVLAFIVQDLQEVTHRDIMIFVLKKKTTQKNYSQLSRKKHQQTAQKKEKDTGWDVTLRGQCTVPSGCRNVE